MECDIYMDLVEEREGCEEIQRLTRRAIKIHKCSECKEDILPGEIYEKVVGKIDGEIFTEKTCSSCLKVRNVFFASYYYGMMWEDLENEIKEINGKVPEACLINLDKKARDKICGIIEEIWEDFDEEE